MLVQRHLKETKVKVTCATLCFSTPLRHVQHIITAFTYTTGHQDTLLAQIFLKSNWKHVENSSGKVTLFTHLLFFFPLCNLNLFAIELSFFFIPLTNYRLSDLINPSFPFSPLEVSAGETRGFHEQLDEQPQRFFTQPTLVFPSLFRKHTHAHTHSGISSPRPTVAYALPADLPWPWCHYFPHSVAVCLRACGCLSENSVWGLSRNIWAYHGLDACACVHNRHKNVWFSYSVVCGQTNSDSRTFLRQINVLDGAQYSLSHHTAVFKYSMFLTCVCMSVCNLHKFLISSIYLLDIGYYCFQLCHLMRMCIYICLYEEDVQKIIFEVNKNFTNKNVNEFLPVFLVSVCWCVQVNVVCIENVKKNV